MHTMEEVLELKWRVTAIRKAKMPVTDMGPGLETQTAQIREEARLRIARSLLEDLEKEKGRLPPGEGVAYVFYHLKMNHFQRLNEVKELKTFFFAYRCQAMPLR